MAVGFSRTGEKFNVVDPILKLTAQKRRFFAEKIEGQQAKDSDAEARSGGDECLGDATGYLGDGELVIADEIEGAHDADHGAKQAEKRREGDDGGEHPEAGF